MRGWRFTDPEFPAYFWGLVNKRGPVPTHRPELGNCWTWHKGDRGRVGVAGKIYLCSRVAWFLAHGRWPKPFALHHCDNPACVRPEHLFEGDQAANMHDMIAKGRERHVAPIGEAHGCAKLTADIVREIRRSQEPHVTLARKYGVTPTAIYNIRKHRVWRHVSESA